MRKTKLFGWLLGIIFCACMVLWMPVSADAADSVETECTHEWVDGTCSACGEACAHASFDDNGFCTVCGTMDITSAVASTTVGGTTTYHLTLDAAIQAVKSCTAEDEAVVKFLKNIALGNSSQTVGSGVFTIDLNGFEISSTRTGGGTLYISGDSTDVTITDSVGTGKISGVFAAVDSCWSNVTICGGSLIGQKRGVYADRSNVTICGGSISGGDYDIYFSGATVKLTLGEAGVGATFPGGIFIKNTTLENILGVGAAYWLDNKMLVRLDSNTNITGGDVIIKAVCTHENGSKGSYIDNGATHTFSYTCCGASITEVHNCTNGACICGATPAASVTICGVTTRYGDLNSAIQAVKNCTVEDNAVVTVLKNLSDVRQYDITGVFTLDLNGCVVRGIRGWYVFYFARSANVTITGGTIIPNLSYAVYNYGGSVIINDVTIVENNASNGVSVSKGGQLTVNGATDISGDHYAIHAYDADVTINGGKFLGYWCINAKNSSNVTINGGVLSNGRYGSTGYHITLEDAASQAVVTTAGVVFKNNLRVSGISLNELLGDGLAYWQNGSMIVPADGATIVSANGDVTVQAACKHENVTASYTDKGIDHTYVYACCGYTVTEAHNYGDDLICDGCGHDKNSIFIMLHDTYTSGWNGNAIKVYEDGVLIATVDLPYGVYHSAWVMPMDLDKEYEFYWVEGQRAYTCSFEIYVAGEKVLTSIPDCRDYFNGELLYSYKVCSGWTQIDGDWYYYDPETNEPVTGIVRVPYPTESINGIAYGPNAEDVAYYENKGQTFIDKNSALFVFDENGVFQSDLNGLTGDDRWAVNGCIIWHIGLVQAGEDYYYFLGDAVNGGNQMATGDVHVGRNTTDLDAVLGGVYTFGEDGKLCKYDGIVDLRYYENYRLMLGNGLTKVGEYYIYVRSSGELAVDCEYYVPGNDLGIAAGTYTFDENGFLVEPISSEKNGVYFENGAWYYYENGKIGYNKGLTAYGDGYIYVRSSGKLATGAYYITNVPEELSSLFRVGQKVIFNENGIADAPKHGIVDGYYYQYGAVRYNAGLIQVDGKWIYVRSNGALATGRYWVTNTNGAMEAGYYEFDKNGYMIISEIEDGIVAEGENLYYYLDGKKQFGLGLVMLEDGSYIYVRTGGELAVGSYWITNHNGLLIEGMYEFSQDGTLTIN